MMLRRSKTSWISSVSDKVGTDQALSCSAVCTAKISRFYLAPLLFLINRSARRFASIAAAWTQKYKMQPPSMSFISAFDYTLASAISVISLTVKSENQAQS
uniref:Uncharacterized protein n=1 Tax=Oryza brachyantha TaxID=4533 RepID=J3LZM7_ORYBR